MNLSAYISDLLFSESLPDALGQQWQMDFAECQAVTPLLEDAQTLEEILNGTLYKAALHIEGQTFQQSSAQQVTGSIMLADGHLNVRTWISPKLVSLDLYLASTLNDYQAKGEQLCQLLLALFAPQRYNFQSSPRRFASPPPTQRPWPIAQ